MEGCTSGGKPFGEIDFLYFPIYRLFKEVQMQGIAKT